MTFATLRAEGKIPVDKERLKTKARGLEMNGMTLLTIVGLISS
jgi:hypothetical protein